jgi:hypothetical protein
MSDATLISNAHSDLNRIILDTPALLNLVKHCRESDGNASGLLMGVLMKENNTDSEMNSLKVTQTMPHATNTQMIELMQAMENDQQGLRDTNEVGFYRACRMGLCFTEEILSQLVKSTQKFKNSIMIVYDAQKSDYGL